MSGIFGRLFGKGKNKQSSASEDIIEWLNKDQSDGLAKYRFTSYGIKKAFESVTAGIDTSPESKAAILADLLSNETQSVGDIEKIFVCALSGTEWRWAEFEHWRAEFERRGQYPYMWTYLHLADKPPKMPDGMADAVKCFASIQDMKTCLINNGYKPKPMPKHREGWEIWAIQNVSFEKLRPELEENNAKSLTLWDRWQNEARCKLLAHTFDMSCYSLKDVDKPHEHSFQAIESTDDPVELEIAKQFNAGIIKGIPPFFPGDRTCLVTVA